MSLIYPNFDVKSTFFFPNFGQRPFPKIAGKGPEISCLGLCLIRFEIAFGHKHFKVNSQNVCLSRAYDNYFYVHLFTTELG